MPPGASQIPTPSTHIADVNIPGIYCIISETGSLLRWNKTLEYITGATGDALHHQPCETFVDARDKNTFSSFLQHAATTGIAQTDIRLTAAGNTIPYSFTALRTTYEAAPAILLTGTDSSAQKRAAEEMRLSGERYFLTTRATNDMIWDWNLLTNEIWWNYNYNVLFGYGAENTQHHISSWMESIHPDDKERVIKGIYKVINSGEKYWTDEYRYLKSDGAILHMYDRGYVAHDEEGKPYRMIGSMLDITDRIRAEEALREKEERYRNLAANVPEGIFETDINGDTIYVNDKLLEYTGRTFEEMLRTNWIDCVHPDDRQQLIALWQLDLVQKKESSQEYRLVSKNGNVLWVKGKAVPVYDKNGNYNGYLGTVADITSEKLARIELAKSEEKYRTLVEQASDAIYIVDTDGHIITVNPAAGKLSGYTEKELLQMNIMDFVFPEDLVTNPFRIEELRQGKTVTVQRRFRIKNNNILEVECLANMLSDERILVFARDISERIRIQNEILKEKNLSASIINSLPGIFYLYAEQGGFQRWNKNFEYVSGYQPHEIEQMKAEEFFDEDEKQMMQQKVEQVFTTGMADAEAHFYTKDKRKIPYYFNGWRVMFDGKVCLIGVGIDITEKRKAEQELHRSHNDIRRLASHLNKIREEERKRIGREIHDELGQQLTAIKMDMAWIDKKTTEENELIKTKIRNVISLLDGSNRSVRRILTELGPGVNDEKGLPEALERQNRQFEETTGISIQFEQPDAPVILPQDTANTLFRIYQESLTNIMRYAKATAVITSLKMSDETVEMMIKDDGKGFDKNQLPSGNSFGIIGMKERVLEQKGTFTLQSVPGKGTTITVSIPLPTPETKPSE